MRRRTFLKAMGSLAVALPSTRALSQGRTVRMVVPLPPGSSNDTSTRVIAAALAPMLGQTIIVDNKPGADGVIGTLEVVRAKPDGFTLLAGSLSPLAVNMAVVKNMPYDPRRDLTPIAGTTTTSHVLVVAPNSPIRTMAEFVEYAKKRPGEISVGYSTTLVQMQIASLNTLAGIQLLPVPYKGAPQSVTDVMGGVLTATIANPGPAISLVKNGQLRALGIAAVKRNPMMPDWPAISETLPGFDFPAWNAVVGPPGMSEELVNRLSASIAEALKQPDVIQKLGNEATIPLIMGPGELRSYVDSEVAKFLEIAKSANIQPE